MKSISIIIPVVNEQANIEPLVKRIHQALIGRITYEIIFIDDHSTDRTTDEIIRLMGSYPIRWYEKKGEQGKAQSLIEGFKKAKYDLICMIDGDLQYPPESIPVMVRKIEQGDDIVVAERNDFNANLVRRIFSRSCKFLTAKLLHNLDCDVQSGLKVFRKEIIDRIKIKASQWAFDLEFLVKAKDAGYTITTIQITFDKRVNGEAKINLLSATYQIMLAALKLKFRDIEVIPLHPVVAKKKGRGFHYRGAEFIHHSYLDPSETALTRLNINQILIGLSLLLVLYISFLLNWHVTLIALVAIITTFYFLDLAFNFILILFSFYKRPEIQVTASQIEERNMLEWPVYTILCPLYKEWEVVPQFVNAMQNLDYPKEKLQVMLLLEADDKHTIAKVREFSLPDYFQIVVVPDSKPKTKPKACNYGLNRAIGKYVVIYDAEDVPDKEQLKKAVIAFEQSDKEVACVQAKLNFYNPHHNLLTRLFTAEYSLWFDLVLTGLQSITAPIPLGGTSNHFRVRELIALKGWDSFNVTEDCDLGIRLAKKGYRTELIDSLTLEEANSDWKNWFYQRSRWIKGYFQTYLVHMRNPRSFFSNRFGANFLAFQIIVGGKVFSMLINPFMWLITIAYFAKRTEWGAFIETFFPAPVLYMGVIALVMGNFLYLYYYMIGCAKRKHYDLIKYVFIVPFYWLYMSYTAWYAMYKLITAPHHWAKTKHGLHLKNVAATAQTHTVLQVHNSTKKLDTHEFGFLSHVN